MTAVTALTACLYQTLRHPQPSAYTHRQPHRRRQDALARMRAIDLAGSRQVLFADEALITVRVRVRIRVRVVAVS